LFFFKVVIYNKYTYFRAIAIHPQGVSSTHATSNLGIWLNGKIGLYLEDLANPNNGLNLVPNFCSAGTLEM
jgi:hypothetical protein